MVGPAVARPERHHRPCPVNSRFRWWLKDAASWLPAAMLAGALIGLAFPPTDLWWLVWLGLVPLLWILYQPVDRLRAFLAGFVGGVIFGLIVLRPVVSAYLWSGWQEDIDLETATARQHQVLLVLWVLVSVWGGGLFWGAFALALSRLAGGSLVRMALIAPALFVLVAEWLRSLATWHNQWAFLGNALVETENLRQLAAVGGVWSLTWLAVLGNVGVLAILLNLRRSKPRHWGVAASVATVLAISIAGGNWQLRQTENMLEEQSEIAVAALQYHKPEYYLSDYIEIGLERQYVELLSQIMTGQTDEIELLVLPESVALTAISLDGSYTSTLPHDMQFSIQSWARVVLGIMDLGDSSTAIVMGLNAVEAGRKHNSMVYWSPMGLAGHYHKQRLVPFAEYSPGILQKLGLRGESQYHPGNSSHTVELNNLRLGTFICQEVLIPRVSRQAANNGAQLLITGGNDGVFADPAVALVNARSAQLRAVETGRYVIRAMKTGISAVIDPAGRETSRSPGSEPHLVRGHAKPLDHSTFYVRHGDWLLIAALVLIALAVVSRCTPRHPRENSRPTPILRG